VNLEFFIKLRELVSSGLVKMASTAQKTTASIRGFNGTLSQSYDTIARKVRELEGTISKSTSVKQIRDARRELEQLNRIASRAPGNIQGAAGSSGLMSMIRSYIGPLAIAGAIGGIFGAGAKQESSLTSLSTFLGKDKAQTAYSNIRQDAIATPYGVESLLNVNRALISTGVSAEKARKDTLNLANAISATGGGNDELMRMAVNMQQIANAGKATGVDIKQFAYAGINIYGILAAATGKTKEQVKDMEVTYELLTYALDKAGKAGGLYAGAMDAQMKTVGGRFAMFKDSISMGAADMGTALQPFWHGLIDLGMTLTNTIIPAFITTVTWLRENWSWIGLLASVVGGAVVAYKSVIIATQLWAFAQTLLNTAMMMNPVGLVIAAIAALVAGIIYAYKHFEGFRKVVHGLWESFKQVFTNIGNFFKQIFAPIFEAITAFKEGRYLDAGKAVAKLVYNISPVGLAANAIGFAAKGGFTAGVSDAWKRGQAIGAAKGNSSDASTPTAATVGGAIPSFATGDDTAKGIAGGGPRIININGVKFAEKIEIHTTTLDKGLDGVKEQLDEYLLRLLNSGAAVQ